MVSLRDPVRDNCCSSISPRAWRAAACCWRRLSGLDYERWFGKLSFVPLLASFALSALLIVFGRGPGTSDAKVNLFGFQPVEIIRLLLVFFLAGYFGRRWDVLRHARETRPSLARLTSRFDIPPRRIHPPRAGLRGALAGVLLPAEGYGAGAGVRLPVSGALRPGARQLLRARRRAGAGGCGIRGRLSSSACPTPCASASPCGFRPGTT